MVADQQAFIDAIESEDAALAVNTVRALLASAEPETTMPVAQRWFIDAVSRHHYNYGHGAIYTQKVFALIQRIPHVAELLLTELAMTLVYGTREDTLPYMSKANAAIADVDLDALASAAKSASRAVRDDDALIHRLLDADQVPISELVEAALATGGVETILNVVSLAASHRMLRFDLAVERDRHEEFGWLDITHVLTYVNAARWAWRVDPGPRSTRLALLTAFLAFDSGRAERRIGRTDSNFPAPANGDPANGDLVAAVLEHRPDAAVAAALAGPVDAVADQLEQASLEDLSLIHI